MIQPCQFKPNNKRRTLYEFDWQLLRVSLAFTNKESLTQSLVAITVFLSNKKFSARALYKAINLLSAVSMGLHSMSHTTELIAQVQGFRESLSKLYRMEEKKEKWLTDNVQREQELSLYTAEQIVKVYKDLFKRLDRHNKITRPELDEYVQLLERELANRENNTLADKKQNN